MIEQAAPPALEELLEFITGERGFDFTGYKRPSLMRRISKRMQAIGHDSDFAAYREYLERNPDEFVDLFNSILINVTGFFRDRPAWEFLREEVVPQIIRAKDEPAPIRAWSTGCATGEEAYTIAMVLAEVIGEPEFRNRVKIYATDVDEEALAIGRHGLYASSTLQDVPEPLRERYFERIDGRFAFRKDLRRCVIFGRHDLIQDPPISRVDLLVSGNTLMYFDAEIQRRILTSFNFSLTEEGCLFLGKSGVLVTRTGLFVPLDLKRRVFVKSQRPELPFVPRPRPEGESWHVSEDSPGWAVAAGFEHSPLAQVIVEAPGRLMAANAEALSLFGLGRPDIGRPLQDLEISHRPLELRSRIEQVQTERRPVSVKGVIFQPPGAEPRTLDVLFSPLVSGGGILAVTIAFLDTTRLTHIEAELERSRREAETTYEELQATVEELETTNEELQSTNEELETMNDELRQRTDEASMANLFLESVLGGVGVGVAVIDRKLTVEIWSREAEQLWGLRSHEAIGQHFLNLDIGLPLDQLRQPIRACLAGEEVSPLEVEAVSRRGRPISCRLTVTALPGTGEDEVGGAILLMEASDHS